MFIQAARIVEDEPYDLLLRRRIVLDMRELAGIVGHEEAFLFLERAFRGLSEWPDRERDWDAEEKDRRMEKSAD